MQESFKEFCVIVPYSICILVGKTDSQFKNILQHFIPHRPQDKVVLFWWDLVLTPGMSYLRQYLWTMRPPKAGDEEISHTWGCFCQHSLIPMLFVHYVVWVHKSFWFPRWHGFSCQLINGYRSWDQQLGHITGVYKQSLGSQVLNMTKVISNALTL